MKIISLCYAVEHADREVLQRQLEIFHTLTWEFRELYPLSYFKPDVWSSSERVMLTSQRWLSVYQITNGGPNSLTCFERVIFGITLNYTKYP